MSSEPPRLYVAAKNMFTTKLVVLPCEKFYVLLDNDSVYMKFNPQKCDDFDSGLHYGMIEKDYMVIYVILGMSSDSESLASRINDREHPKRIRNSKRLSIDVARKLLSDMKPYDIDKAPAKSEKKSAVQKDKDKGAKETEDVILKKYAKKKSQEAKQSRNIKQAVELSTFGNGESKSGSSPSQLESQKSKIAAKNSKGAQAMETEDRSTLGTSSGNSETEILRAQLEAAQKQIQQYEAEKNSKIDELNNKVDEIRGAIHHSDKSKGLSDMDDGLSVPMEDESEIPNGKVHFGKGILVDKNDIKAVETKSFDFRKRVKFILQLCYPNDLHLKTLNPDLVGSSSTAENIHEIPGTVPTVISRILKKMCWDGDLTKEKVTIQAVHSFVRRLTYDARKQRQFDALSPTKKAAMKIAKREKAREFRKRQAKKKEEARAKKQEEARAKAKKRKHSPVSTDNDDDINKVVSESEESCSTD